MPQIDPLVAEYKNEGSNTRKMLERVPTDQLNWKPHPKSYSLVQLAQHIANLPVWIDHILNHDELDLANPIEKPDPSLTNEQLLEFFTQRFTDGLLILEKTTDEMLNGKWTMKSGDHIFFTLPKKVVLRNFVFNHIVHHRGQLSVYLRLLDIPVPGMYGPSADENNMRKES